MTAPVQRATPARVTFAGGGWVVVLAILLIIGIIIWSFAGVMLGHGRIGDGRSIDSYRFDLVDLRVPRESLAASGQPRDFLLPLDHPEIVDGRDVVTLNESLRRKLAVSSDRVIGVVVEGVARAYPLRLLNAHEVVNDTIAGVPVAVTYSPLCDSAFVFKRTIGERDLHFGVSGLLLNSNLLFYDTESPTPGLWSQLDMAAISGPMAGTPLEPLKGVTITTWATWLAIHPETGLIKGELATKRRYDAISYSRYFLERKLKFPVEPLPSEESMRSAGLHLKSPIVAIGLPGSSAGIDADSSANDHSSARRWIILPIEAMVDAFGREGRGQIEVDGLRLRVRVSAEPAGAIVTDVDGEPFLTVPCLWFAWYAFHPDAIALSADSPATVWRKE